MRFVALESGLVLFFLLGKVAADAIGNGDFLACLGFSCSQENDLFGVPMKIPCSAASGKVPIGLKLPMYFEGNYDLCKTFDAAHYCTIRTTVIGPLGDFRQNLCVKKACTAKHMQSFFSKSESSIKHLLEPVVPKELFDMIKGVNVSVTCMDDSSKPYLDAAGYTTLSFFLLMVALVLGATASHVYFGCVPDTSTFIGLFSAKKNLEKLCSIGGGMEFAVLNGVRVYSIVWIIFGHTALNNLSPSIVNPTLMQQFLQTYTFAWIPGAEYAVDTFFFLSAFLATTIVLRQLRKTGLSARGYFFIIFARYMRLTPVYAMALFMWYKVFPVMYDGPLWREQFHAMMPGAYDSTMCSETWWKNLLYVNNFVGDTTPQCAGWTWYLANDFQFFLLVPLFAAQFLFWRRRGKVLYSYALLIAMVVAQIIYTFVVMYDHGMTGSILSPGYFNRIYFFPLARITPYMAGMALAMFHFHRVDGHVLTPEMVEKGSLRFKYGQSLQLFGLTTMAVLISVRYFQYECKQSEANCNAWFGQYVIGGLAYPNWKPAGAAAFVALAWPIWSAALALVLYSFTCGHDSLKVSWLISHPLFVVPARLTYCAYLIHMPVMFAFVFSQHVLPSFHGWNIITQGLSFVCIAYTIAFALFLVIEKPFMNLFSVLVIKAAIKQGSSPIEPSQQQAILERRLSSTHGTDSDSVIMASPLLESGAEAQVQSQGAAAVDQYVALDSNA